jgi:glutamate dehydrogenase/leucine dehydrogenase
MITAFDDVYAMCHQVNCRLRRAAYRLAVRRVLHAERLRGNV